MNEARELCRRVIGPGPEADGIAERARQRGGGRIAELTAAASMCRMLSETGDLEGLNERSAGPALEGGQLGSSPAGSVRTLAQSVSEEMSSAAARLPERQREVLALRELLGLNHDEVAAVMSIDPSAVPSLLARARLSLRRERRGGLGGAESACAEHDRSLRTLARRQDDEPVGGADEQWLFDHLGTCQSCEAAHAAMLEASLCYRAWRA